jgi:hypothetical protein
MLIVFNQLKLTKKYFFGLYIFFYVVRFLLGVYTEIPLQGSKWALFYDSIGWLSLVETVIIPLVFCKTKNRRIEKLLLLILIFNIVSFILYIFC